MKDEMEDILQGLQIAIKSENDGHFFYDMAAKITDDPKGREMFEKLAQEERNHLEFLKSQREAILKDGQVNADLKLGPHLVPVGSSPIFSDELTMRIEEAHYEMTSLSVGIQLELNAMMFYLARAEETKNDTVRTFYKDLAEWERGHYNLLLNQQEALKEEYWTENRFSPM